MAQSDHSLSLVMRFLHIPDDGIEDLLVDKQAMNDVDKDQWIKAMYLEIEYTSTRGGLQMDLQEETRPSG